ncbi:unnamed protein product [marine sediment metagenome]|uniref:Uncharacterized protein n=1 Tax=marine sediment metagenome TaxID=412755 RepID=X1AYB4_9ZZZZ
MISEKEFKNNEEVLNFEELEAIRKQKKVEKIYEIIEQKNINEVFPNYDFQEEELTQVILEVYKMIFWGILALISTLLWLYLFIN